MGVVRPGSESSDFLYPDGVDSARGWTPQAGTYGSQARWDNKLELRLQVVRDFLWVVGFMDATGFWNTPADVLPLGSDAFCSLLEPGCD